MNWNLFLLMFYGKVLLIYIFAGYLFVRYIRKGCIRFDPEIMVQCRLKEVLRKRKKSVNFLINLIVITSIIFVSCSFGLSALIDIPIVITGKEEVLEGIVVKGDNVKFSNKLECYSVVVQEENGNQLHELELYWENGICKDDFIKVKFLPHSKTGVVIKRYEKQ